jgi:adenosylhomocysteine nucleosidase
LILRDAKNLASRFLPKFLLLTNLTAPSKAFLFIALPCEAKPLIDTYKLKKDTSIHAFNIFRNNDIILTVTGIGKTAMAAGVAYSQALFQEDNPICLNIGIAGHHDHPIGSLFLADKIADNETGRHYYPPLVFTPPCPTSELLTFAKPQAAYPDSALCDMEASSFYETAIRFSTGELCQCLKVISDNADLPASQIQAQTVSTLIHDQLATIKQVVADLTRLAGSLPAVGDKALLQLIGARYRFSVSEQIQLVKSLNRWTVMTNNSTLKPDTIPAKSGKEFLAEFSRRLDAMDFTL